MNKLHDSAPERNLEVCIRAGGNEFDGGFFGLRLRELRKEYGSGSKPRLTCARRWRLRFASRGLRVARAIAACSSLSATRDASRSEPAARYRSRAASISAVWPSSSRSAAVRAI